MRNGTIVSIPILSQTINDKANKKSKLDIQNQLRDKQTNVTTKCFKDFNIRHKQTHSTFNVKKWEQKNMNKKTIINTIEFIETNIYSAIYNNRFNFSGPNHIQTLINSSSNTTQKNEVKYRFDPFISENPQN